MRLRSCIVMAVATAPIRLLAWEPPYAAGEAPKRPKKKKKVVQIVNGEELYKGIGGGKEITDRI